MPSRPDDPNVVRIDADLVPLARAYLDKRTKEPELIGLALARRDFPALYRIGHNLHGSGQMFGFAELTAIGAELQQAVEARDSAGIERLGRRIADFVSRTRVESGPSAAARAAAVSDTDGSAPRRVLVVDDDEMNRTLIAHCLEKQACRVTQCAGGEEALAALHSEPLPALILLDVVMPGMSGLEVCRRIKADPETGAIPIILLTALEKREDRRRGMQAGADDFLIKPVSRRALLERVSRLLPQISAPAGR